MADALAFLPAVTLDAAEAAALAHGQKVEPRGGAGLPPAGAPAAAPPLVRALAPDGRLVAVCAWAAPALRPLRVVLGAGALGPDGGGAGQDR
jgi:tRNA pseudouridine55 synthase